MFYQQTPYLRRLGLTTMIQIDYILHTHNIGTFLIRFFKIIILADLEKWPNGYCLKYM